MSVFPRIAFRWLILFTFLIAILGISITQFGIITVQAATTVIASDLVNSSSQNLISYTNPYTDAFSSNGDGFQVYQRGVSPNIPAAILDDSLSGNDRLGIIKSANTDTFFGIVDTYNNDNIVPITATWVFDISSASDLSLSIDMASMGDFESSDVFEWAYSIDGGASQVAFSALADESGSYAYTMESGKNINLSDPMTVNSTTLTNNLTTFTTAIVGTGSQLTLTLTADFNGGSEAVAFQNIIINGTSGSVTPTNTLTFTPTFTSTNTPTNTPTFTPTFTPTNTPTNTPTFTPTFTPTNTPTFTPTNTPTNTPTFTPTFTPTNTPTFTPTNTPTNTPTFTPTFTPTNTPMPTATQPTGEGVIASDLVNSGNQNLISYTNPYTNAFTATDDGFQVYQRGVSANLPTSLLDDSLSGSDSLGIIKSGNLHAFFGVVDTVNNDNTGPITATWIFDVSSGSNMELSIDMAAMGDFEASDVFEWAYSIDGGASQVAFTSVADEAATYSYIMESGASVNLADPMTVNSTILTNDLTTFTTAIVGSGSQLTLTLTADFNGGTEVIAFQNIVISGTGGVPPTATPPPGALTLIHNVQGDGAVSPLNTQIVTIEGIVVGDFQNLLGTNGDLSGIFVQEEDSDADADPMTSEGIFVYEGINPSVDIAIGDLVQVEGTVAEFNGQTQITSTSITVLSSANPLPTAGIVTLPLGSLAEWEYVEGMLVTVQATGGLTVNDNYDLGRYGSFQLSSDGRIPIYSQNNTPTDAASFDAYAAAAALRVVLVDDGRTNQNPDPTVFINGAPFSATNTLRVGYTSTGITGVMEYSFGEYRLQPTQAINLTTSSNERVAQAPLFGATLRVASANLLNYFNGNGQGGGFPTARGADTYAEFVRQHDKTIAALVGLDADIIGVVEIENDYGDGLNSAAQDVVDGLNAATTSCGANWAYVDPGVSLLGDDAIAVGFIYCSATVQIAPGTSPAILDDSQLAGLGLSGLAPVFNGVSTNRASFAVTFREIASGGDITVVANHFKSKGGTGTGDNADTGNGAGNYNQRRRDAATVLAAWMATNPTGTSDPDILLLGDLNSYALEDPILDLAASGYTNLVTDPDAYSYGFPLVFGGSPEVQGWGTLDYALANASLAAQVTGAGEWHNNADEPVYIDYNVEFKPAGQLASLYSPDAYRASDHDPLVVGINLGQAPQANLVLVHSEPYLQGETLSLASTDVVAEGETLNFEVDCTNDGQFDIASDTVIHNCNYPDAGNFMVRQRITDNFGGSSEHMLQVQILSPFESLDYLNNMVGATALNNGQLNKLNPLFVSATQALQHGDSAAAISQLQELIAQMQVLIDSGTISANEGNNVIYMTQRVMASIIFVYGL